MFLADGFDHALSTLTGWPLAAVIVSAMVVFGFIVWCMTRGW